MRITVLSVEIETVKKATSSYQKAEVAYKDETGKVTGKKVMSFVNEKVFDFLKTCSGGDVLDVTSEKDANGYWQWTAVEKASGEASVATASTGTGTAGNKTQVGSTPTPRSTYETPEERAVKQRYIVRQSSVSAAIALLDSNGGKKNTKEEVIEVAKYFEAYVFGAEFDDGSVEAMKGDEKDVF